MSRRRLGACFAVVGVLAALGACDQGSDPQPTAVGDADHGRALFVEYGCAACHQVRGVRTADGRVGPALDGLRDQRIIAGVLPNTPEFLAAFIQQPQEYAPNTAMPDLDVGPEDAGHLTAFLLER